MIDSDDFLSAAGFAFERQRGVPLSPYELAIIEEAGLAGADCERIADEVWGSLEEERPEAYRATAYWVLGKQYRAPDKKRLIDALARELPKSMHVTYQIMIALENYGEDVFAPSRRGTGYDEAELNRADAMAYIARQR